MQPLFSTLKYLEVFHLELSMSKHVLIVHIFVKLFLFLSWPHT